MLKGIDISQWQGNVDFAKVKKSVDFVIMKATEGVGFVDPKLKINQTNARGEELLLGYYCFTRPDLGNKVEDEVDFFLKAVKPVNGEVLFLDYEVNYSKPVDWCKRWLDYLSTKLEGYKGLVYLNQSLLKNNDWKPLIDKSYGLWLAVYDYNPDSVMPDTKWGLMAFRQYTNKLAVTGISGGVDGNVFYGDKVAYKKYGIHISSEGENATQGIVEGLKMQLESLQAKLTECESKPPITQLIPTPIKDISVFTTKELVSALYKRLLNKS